MLKCFVPAAVFCLGISALYAQDSGAVKEEKSEKKSIVVEQTLGDIVVEEEGSDESEAIVVPQSSGGSESAAGTSPAEDDPAADVEEMPQEHNEEAQASEGDLFIISDEEESILTTGKQQESQVEQPDADSSVAPQMSEEKSAVSTPQNKLPPRKVTRPTHTNPDLPQSDSDGSTAEESEVVVDPVVESTRSINFAKNADEYRSPKKAMLMSLLVPGLGQAYVKKYVKTAIFGVAEAAIIGFAINSHLKGNDQRDQAHAFADRNYDPGKMEEFYTGLEQHIRQKEPDDYRNILSSWIDSGIVRKSSLDDNYYQKIENKSYVQGWKDNEPDFSGGQYVMESEDYRYVYGNYLDGQDSTWLINRLNDQGEVIEGGIFGYSENQIAYNDMISDANGHYKVSTRLLFLLVANHIVSAVDALITANAHNDALLERESVWQRIDLDQQMAFTGSDIKARLGLNIRF